MAEGEPRSAVFEQGLSFGARLRQLRETAGLTQEELAEKAGLSRKAISVLERGARKRPYPHTVRSLADALDLPEDERASLLAAVQRRNRKDASPHHPEEDSSPTAPAANPDHALPAPPTPLVGRERELEEVVGFLGRPETRLLTLTGTGGVGKTRLAIEAVREAAMLFPDGAVFVTLAPLGDPDLVVPTVAQSLGLRRTGGRGPREALRAYLREKRFLLALDNFEHVLEAAAEVAALIESCPNLTVLATSRAPLRLRSEQEYPVGPLALPDSTLSPAVEKVGGSSSVRLFFQRARATYPAFEITDENASAVATICWRLSGIPLALELAAAKTRFLDPEALLSRLDRALSAGPWTRDVPERQRTMHSTLDWSHDLLSEGEKALFRRLSVFSGGLTLEAAEEVCASEGVVDADEVLELLGRLAEQSLVIVTRDRHPQTRYGLLEPVRQYAREKLDEGGEAEEVRLRHASFYLALAEEAEPRIKGQDQVEWLDKLEADNDNFRAAIGRSLEAGDALTAARFGWALAVYWVMRARREEGRLLMERTLSGGNLPARMRARALYALGLCVNGSGEDRRLMAVSEESVALFREAGDGHGEAYALLVLSFAALQLGDLDLAERVLEQALEGFRRYADAWGSAHSLNHLAVASYRRGNYPLAAGHAEEGLAVTRRSGDRLGANVALHLLAQAAWASDEQERAARYFREALVLASEAGDKTSSAYCMQGLADVAGARGQPRRAARLLGAA
ncbi:MAG: helix-turn-helix domain-containing protein, partial [Actinomycetota bacterium]|nr:helix-turn-helix domain-containing protein [Actinomycetota bacterium]